MELYIFHRHLIIIIHLDNWCFDHYASFRQNNHIYVDYHHWDDTSDDGLLNSNGIIGPVISASALSWFLFDILMFEIYSSKLLQVIYTNVRLPQELVTWSDLVYPVKPLWLQCSQILVYIDSPPVARGVRYFSTQES